MRVLCRSQFQSSVEEVLGEIWQFNKLERRKSIPEQNFSLFSTRNGIIQKCSLAVYLKRVGIRSILNDGFYSSSSELETSIYKWLPLLGKTERIRHPKYFRFKNLLPKWEKIICQVEEDMMTQVSGWCWFGMWIRR